MAITAMLDNVCMYGHTTYSKRSMDKPGKVASLAPRGQLNGENNHFPVRVRAREFGLARRGFGSSVPRQPAHHLHTYSVRLNLILTYGIPPEFRGGVHLFI